MERPRFELASSFSKKEEAKKPEEAPNVGSMKEYVMRLKELCPDFSDTELEMFRAAKSLFKGLSPEKRVHARNVSLRVARMFPESDVILGALLHDTQEQTPKAYRAMEKELPPMVRDLVNALSEDDHQVKGKENTPLVHLQAVLPTLSPEIKNRAILIKLSDRLDNLQKRLEEGSISKGYRKKSEELIAYLESEFDPVDADPLNELQLRQVKNELAQLITSSKKRKRELRRAA